MTGYRYNVRLYRSAVARPTNGFIWHADAYACFDVEEADSHYFHGMAFESGHNATAELTQTILRRLGLRHGLIYTFPSELGVRDIFSVADEVNNLLGNGAMIVTRNTLTGRDFQLTFPERYHPIEMAALHESGMGLSPTLTFLAQRYSMAAVEQCWPALRGVFIKTYGMAPSSVSRHFTAWRKGGTYC